MRIKLLLLILFLSISCPMFSESSIRINWKKAADDAKAVNRLGAAFGLVQNVIRYNKVTRMAYGKLRGGLGKLSLLLKDSKITSDNTKRLKILDQEINKVIYSAGGVERLSQNQRLGLCRKVLEMQKIITAIKKEVTKAQDYNASWKGGIDYYTHDTDQAKLVRDKNTLERYNDKRENMDERDLSTIKASIATLEKSIENYENNSKKVGKKSFTSQPNVNLNSEVSDLKKALKDLEQVAAIGESVNNRYNQLQCDLAFNNLRSQASAINNTENKR